MLLGALDHPIQFRHLIQILVKLSHRCSKCLTLEGHIFRTFSYLPKQERILVTIIHHFCDEKTSCTTRHQIYLCLT